jgi:hypothetical protein
MEKAAYKTIDIDIIKNQKPIADAQECVSPIKKNTSSATRIPPIYFSIYLSITYPQYLFIKLLLTAYHSFDHTPSVGLSNKNTIVTDDSASILCDSANCDGVMISILY